MIGSSKRLVSVILPVFNVEKFIGTCLETIINQTYKNLEIVVVDDGSPDKSIDIVKDFMQKDSRIKLIRQNNMGFSGARNTGLENCSGDFVTFVDSDDYLTEDFIEYMYDIYMKTGADICGSYNIFTTKNKIPKVSHDEIKILSAEEAVAEFLYPRIRMGVWNKLWKRDFIEKNNLRFVIGMTTAEGLTFMTNAAQYANKVALGQKQVYCYRLDNPNSATTKANVERQGIGALNALNLIEKNIDMTSTIVKNAMDYQRWGTSAYALRQIIDSGSQNEYQELFNQLHKYIRKNSLKMLKPSIKIDIRMKIIAILRFLDPVLITRISLQLRDRHLKKIKYNRKDII